MFKKSWKCYKYNKYRPGMYDQTHENILRDIPGYNYTLQCSVYNTQTDRSGCMVSSWGAQSEVMWRSERGYGEVGLLQSRWIFS